MSTTVERVARAICENSGQSWESSAEGYREICIGFARAAIEAMPLEQLIRDAYVRGVDWAYETILDPECRFDRGYRVKASADYADKILSAALNEQEQGQ